MAKTIEKGDKLKVHYTGKFDDGEVFDSSDGKDPLEFIIGEKMIIPGFEKAALSLKEGEEKEFKISCKDAYGEESKELIKDIPKEAFGEEVGKIKEGMRFGIPTPQGQVLPAKVVKVGDKTITLDLNHPLAGKNLTFKIKLLEVLKGPFKVEHESCGCGCDEETCQDCAPEEKHAEHKKAHKK